MLVLSIISDVSQAHQDTMEGDKYLGRTVLPHLELVMVGLISIVDIDPLASPTLLSVALALDRSTTNRSR